MALFPISNSKTKYLQSLFSCGNLTMDNNLRMIKFLQNVLRFSVLYKLKYGKWSSVFDPFGSQSRPAVLGVSRAQGTVSRSWVWSLRIGVSTWRYRSIVHAWDWWGRPGGEGQNSHRQGERTCTETGLILLAVRRESECHSLKYTAKDYDEGNRLCTVRIK